jgi:hypothetical protein
MTAFARGWLCTWRCCWNCWTMGAGITQRAVVHRGLLPLEAGQDRAPDGVLGAGSAGRLQKVGCLLGRGHDVAQVMLQERTVYGLTGRWRPRSGSVSPSVVTLCQAMSR